MLQRLFLPLLFATLASAHATRPDDGILVATGTIDAAGLHGRWRTTSDLARNRYATQVDLGVYRIADVYDGQHHWRVEPSGGSHVLDSEFARRATITEAWLATFQWQAARPKSRAMSTDGVLVTPSGGNPVRLWFASNGDLERAVRPTWFRPIETRYSDYRSVGSRRLPFVIVNKEGANEERISIDRYEHIATLPPETFANPGQPDDSSIPAKGTTVPAEIFPQLVVEAMVNGRRMAFVFDSGGHSILTPEAAKLLGLQAVGGQQSGGSGAGTLLAQDTRVAELRIGDAVMRDQHFTVLSLPHAFMDRGALPPLAGLLGLEVLERFTVRLDYRAGKLTLLPRNTAVTCPGNWEAARFTDDMPTIGARLDGLPASFTIDTGNNGSLMLYRHWMDSQSVTARYDRGVEDVSYGAGGASRDWLSYARSFQIGATPLIRYPLVRTTDDKGGVALSVSEAGNLGTSLLANYTFTFDYERSRICVVYVPGYKPLPFNRSGMRTIKEAVDYFLVTLVNDGSPAWTAGLRKGDRILAVNGKTATALDPGAMSLAMTQAPNTVVKLRYARGAKTGEASVVLKELLSPTE